MKLKEDFVVQELGSTQFLVSMNPEAFRGFMRSNETAGAIVDLLKKETTREKVIASMLEAYDAPEEVVAKDVDSILDKLRSIHALEE
ncbi:MAG: PqqD family protein [Blautia sp.]|nr:PqqD family protein [Blautia sp.]